MRGLALALAALALPLTARAEDAPAAPPTQPAPATSGIDGLCSELATQVRGLVPDQAISLQVEAEGAAVDIAESVRTRCAAAFEAGGGKGQPSNERTHVHLRLRVDPAESSLVALVEVKSTASAFAISAPLGTALKSWLASGSRGMETWLVGSVEGTVLALCGANGTVALVQPHHLAFVRWTASGLTPLVRLDLPNTLRTHARSAAASAVCRPSGNGLVVALGMHDRGQGGVVKLEGSTATWTTPLDGIPIGFKEDGSAVLAANEGAANTLRWKDRSYAQVTLQGSSLVGITPAGALVRGEASGPSGTFGTGFAVADLDRDGVMELVVTRPVFPGAGVEDRLSVRPLNNPATVMHESRPVRGVFGAVGLVVEGDAVRAIAAEPGLSRTQLFAVGIRQQGGVE